MHIDGDRVGRFRLVVQRRAGRDRDRAGAVDGERMVVPPGAGQRIGQGVVVGVRRRHRAHRRARGAVLGHAERRWRSRGETRRDVDGSLGHRLVREALRVVACHVPDRVVRARRGNGVAHLHIGVGRRHCRRQRQGHGVAADRRRPAQAHRPFAAPRGLLHREGAVRQGTGGAESLVEDDGQRRPAHSRARHAGAHRVHLVAAERADVAGALRSSVRRFVPRRVRDLGTVEPQHPLRRRGSQCRRRPCRPRPPCSGTSAPSSRCPSGTPQTSNRECQIWPAADDESRWTVGSPDCRTSSPPPSR